MDDFATEFAFTQDDGGGHDVAEVRLKRTTIQLPAIDFPVSRSYSKGIEIAELMRKSKTFWNFRYTNSRFAIF